MGSGHCRAPGLASMRMCCVATAGPPMWLGASCGACSLRSTLTSSMTALAGDALTNQLSHTHAGGKCHSTISPAHPGASKSPAKLSCPGHIIQVPQKALLVCGQALARYCAGHAAVKRPKGLCRKFSHGGIQAAAAQICTQQLPGRIPARPGGLMHLHTFETS